MADKSSRCGCGNGKRNDPKANNDQLGENAYEMTSNKYDNKGPKATEKKK